MSQKEQNLHFPNALSGFVETAAGVMEDLPEETTNELLLQEGFRLLASKLNFFLPTVSDLLIVSNTAARTVIAHWLHEPPPSESEDLIACWHRAASGARLLRDCMDSGKLRMELFGDKAGEHAEARGIAVSLPVRLENGQAVGILTALTRHSEADEDTLLHELGKITAAYELALMAASDRQCDLKLVELQSQGGKEAEKRDMLFQAAKKLLSLIEVDNVLTEMVGYMKKLYPEAEVDLFLTQDNHSSMLPVKPLNFSGLGNDICTRSFMEGKLIHETVGRASGEVETSIAVPLCGKQGVYGVLRLKLAESIEAADVQFMSMLADTAGTAFENAILHEQSNLLIDELRLINEITKRLNQSLRLNEIFTFAMNELLHIFGADYCCILQLDKEKGKLIVQATNLPVLFNENYEMDYGFSGVVYSSREPIIISDYWKHDKVSSSLMELTKSRSLLASPILVGNEVVGVILVAHRKPNFFSYDNYKLLQALSGHIGLAITNASLHAEVRRMVITDTLTGMYARHYLDEQVSMFQKKDSCGSLILTDIDHFKRVNDTFGHQVGDQILRQVSHIIKTSIREIDIPARWGGEELAIYLPQITIEQTISIAERIRSRVAAETDPKVTVSCGVSDWCWQDNRISVETLFYKADMALYEAKNNGRNQIQIG